MDGHSTSNARRRQSSFYFRLRDNEIHLLACHNDPIIQLIFHAQASLVLCSLRNLASHPMGTSSCHILTCFSFYSASHFSLHFFCGLSCCKMGVTGRKFRKVYGRLDLKEDVVTLTVTKVRLWRIFIQSLIFS